MASKKHSFLPIEKLSIDITHNNNKRSDNPMYKLTSIGRCINHILQLFADSKDGSVTISRKELEDNVAIDTNRTDAGDAIAFLIKDGYATRYDKISSSKHAYRKDRENYIKDIRLFTFVATKKLIDTFNQYGVPYKTNPLLLESSRKKALKEQNLIGTPIPKEKPEVKVSDNKTILKLLETYLYNSSSKDSLFTENEKTAITRNDVLAINIALDRIEEEAQLMVGLSKTISDSQVTEDVEKSAKKVLSFVAKFRDIVNNGSSSIIGAIFNLVD